jgi:Mn-dependent DtxR family transcriptional regulator
MISYGHQPFDLYVHETERFLLEDLEAHNWMPRAELIRRVAAHLRTSYATATAVIDDLHELGLLEANYGRYRVKRGRLSL